MLKRAKAAASSLARAFILPSNSPLPSISPSVCAALSTSAVSLSPLLRQCLFTLLSLSAATSVSVVW